MNKVSRNDPCPCGSGKKFKKCCIDKIIPFTFSDGFSGEEIKSPKQILELVKARFTNKEVESIDEMNQELSTIVGNLNLSPKSPFLGMSPAQMHSVLYSPFSFHNDVFTFECFDDNKLKEIPLLKHALFLLNKIREAGEIKSTQTGNLPRSLVREMFNEFFINDRYARMPNTEDDLLGVSRVRNILEISGLIKKRSSKFSLTQKGEKILVENKFIELFHDIFLTFMNDWNWSHGDRYSEFPLIQSSAIFNFLLIHKKCQDWTLDNQLGRFYLEAFPALIHEASQIIDPEREVANCFSTRFLSTVCLPLGLVELREEEGESVFDRKEYFRVTNFFVESFKFSQIFK
jgi:hypothetical protein